MLDVMKTTMRLLTAILLVTTFIPTIGCRNKPQKQNRDFFTSGSREADQRASQRMAKDEQLTGSGEGAGEKGVKKATKTGDSGSQSGSTNKAAQATEKQALFERLGGEQGLNAIVEDFTPRVMQDPRVNWQRNGIKRGGLFHRDQNEAWKASPENISQLNKHLVQFLSLVTGGPAHYDGTDLKSVHSGMRISNPEFDAAIEDLKASLDKLKIPNTEQKELLSIVESTRPLIVTQR